jgi:cell division protein FtsN
MWPGLNYGSCSISSFSDSVAPVLASAYNVVFGLSSAPMPQDYAKNPAKKRQLAGRGNTRKVSQDPRSRWLWLLSGFFVGALFMYSLQIFNNSRETIANAIEDMGSIDAAHPTKPRFDFYTLLRDSEVLVPDVEQSPPRGGSQTDDEVFLLQAGSFRSKGDADSLRARLLLFNLDAHIETTGSRTSDTWYRVIVGPFNSRSRLAGARAKLLQNGIDNLVLKRKENK